MSRGAQIRLSSTKGLPSPNEYVRALLGEFSDWAYDEVKVLEHQGQWRSLFDKELTTPLDLEIGTGNGYHFAWRAEHEPDRLLVGLELKYKPLIQSIRRALRAGCRNARIARYNATMVNRIFAPEELNNVYIHHPDPWPKASQAKHRLIQSVFLEELFALQRPGSEVEFKTDSVEYFDWALPLFESSPYQMVGWSRDLHASKFADTNFVTHFERLFLQKGQPIYYARLRKS
jgi:tRNA (guanine-N7-)-methyltransferase